MLLSIIAARLKIESGKDINVDESGKNIKVDKGNHMPMNKFASEVEKLVMEHLISK